MILEYNNARHHTYGATSAAIEKIRFEVVPHHLYSLDLVLSYCLTSGCFQLSRYMSKEFISHVNIKFKLLWEYEVKNTFKNSTVSKKPCSVVVALYQMRAILHGTNEVQKQSTHSELYFVFCFILIPYLALRTHVEALVSEHSKEIKFKTQPVLEN
jgi:hypothetical protein